MTRPDLDPDLERLGDALRAATAIDLVRKERTALAHPAGPTRARRLRPRLLAGGSLGLAGVGAAIVLVLGGSTAAPAYALTQQDNGTVLLKINYGGPDTIETADAMLTERYHETILIDTAPGPGTDAAPIPCTPTPDTFVSGNPLPSGPSVRLLFGPDNTWTIPADEHNTGDPGTTHHMTSCRTEVRYPFNPATPSNP